MMPAIIRRTISGVATSTTRATAIHTAAGHQPSPDAPAMGDQPCLDNGHKQDVHRTSKIDFGVH